MAFISLLLYITVIYLRPAEWFFLFYGWQLLDILAIAMGVFLIFSLIKTKTKFTKAPQNIFILGFLGALIASHLSHFYFYGALSAFTDFSKTVIMFFLIVNLVNSIKKFKITIWLLIILTLILAVQGIMQYRTGFGLAGQPLTKDGRITWIGIFDNPNDLALALVMIVPFLLNSIFGYSAARYKIIGLPILGILLYAIYLTNSRGGMVALLAVVFFYFLLRLMRKRHPILGIIIGVILVVLLFMHGPSRMGMLSPEEESAYGRLDAWYEGIQMLKLAPLFGVGYNMFMDYHLRVAHNSIIHCAAETGLMGLFFWMGLFYLSYKSLLKIQKLKEHSSKAKNIKSYAFALQISIFGFLTSAFFSSRPYIALPYILIALSVALFNATQKIWGELEANFTLIDLRNIGLLCLSSLGLIWGITRICL
ncbi:MAG: O-antigen ligase family protein [Actinomycetota bacterium]